MEEYFDKIEHYLAGEMSKEEQTSFETELAQNKELKDTVEAHRLAHDAMEVLVEDNLRIELDKLRVEVYPVEKIEPPSKQALKVVSKRRLWPRLAVAASILLLVGFFTFQWAGGSYSTEAIAGNFYNTEDLSNVRSSQAVEYPLEEGINLIKEGKYTDAVAFFQTVPDSSDYVLKALYFLGLSLEQQGQITEAREALQTVIDQKADDPNLAEKAEWLNLLFYLNAEDTENPEFTNLLVKITEDTDHSYHAQATQLKQQLGSVWHRIAR